MNILLWAPFGAGEHYWGPGTSAYRLYNQGLPKEHKLYLAHGYPEQQNYELYSGIYKIADLKTSSYLSQLVFLIKSFIWIKKNAHRFDVVHCLGAFDISFRPAYWLEKRGVAAFCKITGDTGGLIGHSKISRWLGLASDRQNKLNELSGYIAISEEIEKILKRVGVKDKLIHRIPNGVNSTRFKAVAEKEKLALRKKYKLQNKFTVLFVGGISSRKRPLWLLQAFHEVIKKEGDIMQLVFVGPDRSAGEELGKIKEYVRENSLENSVFHFEHSDRPEEFYQLSDVFCLPSRSEGMSNALLEAMATSLPCIVTEISGSKDLIKVGLNGAFVKDVNELSVELNKYYYNSNVTKLYGQNSRVIIEKSYSAKAVLDQHLHLFQFTKK